MRKNTILCLFLVFMSFLTTQTVKEGYCLSKQQLIPHASYEVQANATTQINATIVEVFDNDSIIPTKTSRILDFVDGLAILEGYDTHINRYVYFNITPGDVIVYSFTKQPNYDETTKIYHVGMMAYFDFIDSNYRAYGGGYGAMIFPINTTLIIQLLGSTTNAISYDFYMSSLSTDKIAKNETIGDILKAEFFYNDTTMDFWSGKIYNQELNTTFYVNLTNGALINSTIIYSEHGETIYKLKMKYSEPYNNDGFDKLSINYETKVKEGKLPEVNVSVFDTAGAYYAISFRLKGDTQWIPLYYGEPLTDEFFNYTEIFGTGNYLMDGEYELNISIWSDQAINYEKIVSFTVEENNPANETTVTTTTTITNITTITINGTTLTPPETELTSKGTYPLFSLILLPLFIIFRKRKKS